MSKETGKVLFTNTKDRCPIIIEYANCLKKSDCPFRKESDLPGPKRIIKMVLIEELICPSSRDAGYIKGLESSYMKLESFFPDGTKDLDEAIKFYKELSTSKLPSPFNDDQHFWEFFVHHTADRFSTVLQIMGTNQIECHKRLELFKKIREGSREETLLKQTSEILISLTK